MQEWIMKDNNENIEEVLAQLKATRIFFYNIAQLENKNKHNFISVWI